MSQQINLYNQALLPKADVFSGRMVLLALAGIATLEAANRCIVEHYLAAHNGLFAVASE